MAIEFTIKNTFISVATTIETAIRRSTSLPRSWKSPSPPSNTPTSASSDTVPKAWWADLCPPSDASTKESDDCLSIADQETYQETCFSSNDSDGASSTNGDAAPPPDPHPLERPKKTVLSLVDVISEEAGQGSTKLNKQARLFQPVDVISEEAGQGSTKLNKQARLFQPVSALPLGMRSVIFAARAALCGVPQISNVQMTEGALGSTTAIVGSYTKGSLQSFEMAKLLSMMKKIILNAAAKSANTYVMGYAAQPFVHVGKSGFSAKLGLVPALQKDSMCWCTYRKGFCSGRSKCPWFHPLESELAQIIVMLDEVQPTCQEESRSRCPPAPSLSLHVQRS